MDAGIHMDQIDAVVVEFGPFRLDQARRALSRNGVPVKLGSRAVELLVVLIAQAPETVSKATLMAMVWPSIFIEESTLRFHLSILRKALGEGLGGSYIATANGGYRFVAELSCPAAAIAVAGAVTHENNLPLVLTELIGREETLVELQEWLKDSRSVTVTGPGGVGKTRLAVELGRRLLGRFEGVWLIDLAAVTDAPGVARATAAALGIPLAQTEEAAATIAAALGRAKLLLIFDNCEHLTSATAAVIKTLLECAANVSIVATSQAELHLAIERIYALEPLAVPPLGATAIATFPAVQLFMARAGAADRLFALNGANEAAIAEICRQLDGLPLALEMAAGRLRLLGVQGLQEGLRDRLKMLKGRVIAGARHDSRHDSLRSMLEWSHSLLSPFDQKTFRRLAVFPGAFSLEAAVAVAGWDVAELWDAVESLGRLIERSLVVLAQREPPRYCLLATLRLYAMDSLDQAGETEAAGEHHAKHFTAVFETAESCWGATPDPEWIARYQPELEHLRTALNWGLAKPERRKDAIRLGASGFPLFRWLSLYGEGRSFVNRVIPLLGADIPAVMSGRLFEHAAFCSSVLNDFAAAIGFAERAVALFRACGDVQGLATGLGTLSQLRAFEDQPDAAMALVLEAQALLPNNEYKKTRIRLAAITAGIHSRNGDVPAALHCATEALELARALNSRLEATLQADMGVFEYVLGNFDRAIENQLAALQYSNSRLALNLKGRLLADLAAYLITNGEFLEARLRLEEALSLLIDLQNYPAQSCLLAWTMLASCEGRLAEAAQLLGWDEAEHERQGTNPQFSERRCYDLLEQQLAGLPQTEVAANKARGAQWSEAEAIEFTVSRLSSARNSAA